MIYYRIMQSTLDENCYCLNYIFRHLKVVNLSKFSIRENFESTILQVIQYNLYLNKCCKHPNEYIQHIRFHQIQFQD